MTPERIEEIIEATITPYDIPSIKNDELSDVFLTSDLHFCHDLERMLNTRKSETAEEMNEKIIANWNKIINDDDLVFVLGDIYFGGENSEGPKCFDKLNGHKIIILGNHDQPEKLKKLAECKNTTIINGGSLMVRFGTGKKQKLFCFHTIPQKPTILIEIKNFGKEPGCLMHTDTHIVLKNLNLILPIFITLGLMRIT